MDIHWKQELKKTSYQLLREAGYIPITDKASAKQSYIFKLTTERYPRFHIYVEHESEKALKLHLHLDRRQHGFGQRLHDTEYEGENVQKETERLTRWLQHFTHIEESDDKPDIEEDSRGLLAKLFG